MTDELDLKQFTHERFRRVDEKLDRVLDGLAELRQMVSGVVQILASQDAHMLRIEVRLGQLEKRLELHDPALP